MSSRIVSSYKNAYSGLSRSTWWLSLVMLINRSGTMVIPFITLYLTEQMHYSIGMAGIVMGIYGAGAIFGGLIGGKLTDKFGFYNVQITALTMGGIFFMLLGQMANYTSICICTFVLSVLNDSFRPANATAIAHYSKEENRTRSYSLNRLAINLGWAVGGALGGFIASKNYHLLFWIDGCTNIGAAILLRIVLSPTRNEATPARHEVKKPKEKGPSAYRDVTYLSFIVLTILFGSCFFQIMSTLPVYYRDGMHLTPQFIGIIMAMNGIIIALVEMVLVHKLEGKRSNLQYIALGVFIVGISFAMLNVLPTTATVAIVSMILNTIGEMLAFPFMNSFWISRTTTANRGQYAGLYTVAWSCAQIAGPVAGAQIAEHYGFTILWWVIGALGLIISISSLWMYKRIANTVTLPTAE